MSFISTIDLRHHLDEQARSLLSNNENEAAARSEFVISKAADGSVVSRYKDDVWNMKMYDPAAVTIFSFSNWHHEDESELSLLISDEMKQIQLARLHLFPKLRKPRSLVMTPLYRIAKLAFKNALSIKELFNATNCNRLLIPSYSALSQHPMRDLLFLIKELFSISLLQPSFQLTLTEHNTIELMQNIYDRFPKAQRDKPQQTKLIPSRLYAEFIMALSTELDEFNKYGALICSFFEKRNTNHLFAVGTYRAACNKESISWPDAVKKIGLSSLFYKHSITDWNRLMHYVNEAQTAAQYWIHLFSGMRANEVRHLPADTYKKIISSGVEVSILDGYTSKYSGNNHTTTFWVTAPIVEKAIAAAHHAGTVCALRHNYSNTDLSQYPLFPNLIQKKPEAGYQAFSAAPVVCPSHKSRISRIIDRWPALKVQEADICELERFDGFRDWRNDPDVKISQFWPFATHQCRRSLAVYCARSRLVSLGTMALQFKQLTDAMASYYRRGSAFAVNFVKSDDANGWIDELEHERRVAQYFDYESDVINSTNILWGGEGNRIQNARDKGKPLIITTDRAETRRKFEKGEMVYKNGPIGGCTNLEPCEKISFTSVTACVFCEKSILDDDKSLKKIKHSINKLRREQALFTSDSPHKLQLDIEIDTICKELKKRGLLEKMENKNERD
ncbi:hypothetical protein [Pseudomonas juntendi]|uniref:hypothetical protein n=1 Tax=Pseudomonas juntendi TaxID=2666183 RepID=UPI003B43945B